MGAETLDGASAPFIPLDYVLETQSFIPKPELAERAARRLTEAWLDIFDHPLIGKYKGDKKVALVGGGPSLKTTLDDVRSCDFIIACGSSHDFLIEHGIIPDVCVICDPLRLAADFITKPTTECDYFIASTCDDEVFTALDDCEVYLWHLAGEADEVLKDMRCIGGGCSVTTRALSIAILLGFYDMHFFGFDSSYSDEGDEHSYAHSFGCRDAIDVQVNGGRVFKTTPEWLAQAQHFQEMVKNFGGLFDYTIYGDGLIAEMAKPTTKEDVNG